VKKLKYSAPTSSEFQEIKKWLSTNSNGIPENILLILRKTIAVYESLTLSKARAKNALDTLRKAMGFIPKSEKGSQEEEQLKLPELTPEIQVEIDSIKKKQIEITNQQKDYAAKLKSLIPAHKNPNQLELNLADACEMLFSSTTYDNSKVESKMRINRQEEFDKTHGLRSTIDRTTRYDLKMSMIQIDYEVETVEDLTTGKKVRASMHGEGPEKFQLTWGAISNLIKMHVGFAIPINRMVLMIGKPEFTSGKICRVFEYMATQLLPIYFALAEEISDVKNISGDDTSTKVLELEEAKEFKLANEIDKHFKWTHQKASGGAKTAVNVSLLIGKTEADPRSTIRFFRTHIGSVGNLLSQLLEWRNPKNKELIFQGDMSSTNLPKEELRKNFNFLVAGCGSHARRPFWRYRQDDPNLCYYMLRAFLMLAQLEKRIDNAGRTRVNVLKYRSRYGKMLWIAIRKRCEATFTGKFLSQFPMKDNCGPNIWPPGTDLHKSCKYIVNNFEALTLYLKIPELKYTNNGSERALRIEKCMLNGSKFRKTRNGRAVLDVLRTINATATAAGLDLTEYFKYVFTHKDQLQTAPEVLTPYKVAIALEIAKALKK
jgi:Transposase IS66 family